MGEDERNGCYNPFCDDFKDEATEFCQECAKYSRVSENMPEPDDYDDSPRDYEEVHDEWAFACPE